MTYSKQLEPIILQENQNAETSKIENICASFLLKLASQFPKREEANCSPYHISQVHNFAMARQNEVGDASAPLIEKFDRVCEHLLDHERKIEILRDAGEQAIVKTRELDQVKNQIISYTNSLEPWKSNISVLTEDILNGARALEGAVNSSVQGMMELNSRVITLEAELCNMKLENETLRERITGLTEQQRQDFGLQSVGGREHSESINLIKALESEFKSMKSKLEWDIQRLESLVIEKIMQDVKPGVEEVKLDNENMGLKSEIDKMNLSLKVLEKQMAKTEQHIVTMEKERKGEKLKKVKQMDLSMRETQVQANSGLQGTADHPGIQDHTEEVISRKTKKELKRDRQKYGNNIEVGPYYDESSGWDNKMRGQNREDSFGIYNHGMRTSSYHRRIGAKYVKVYVPKDSSNACSNVEQRIQGSFVNNSKDFCLSHKGEEKRGDPTSLSKKNLYHKSNWGRNSQWKKAQRSNGKSNFYPYYPVTNGYFHGRPCDRDGLWYPVFQPQFVHRKGQL